MKTPATQDNAAFPKCDFILCDFLLNNESDLECFKLKCLMTKILQEKYKYTEARCCSRAIFELCCRGGGTTGLMKACRGREQRDRDSTVTRWSITPDYCPPHKATQLLHPLSCPHQRAFTGIISKKHPQVTFGRFESKFPFWLKREWKKKRERREGGNHIQFKAAINMTCLWSGSIIHSWWNCRSCQSWI